MIKNAGIPVIVGEFGFSPLYHGLPVAPIPEEHVINASVFPNPAAGEFTLHRLDFQIPATKTESIQATEIMGPRHRLGTIDDRKQKNVKL